MQALNREDIADKGKLSVTGRYTISDARPSSEEPPIGITELLDQFIPLDGASHAEVASYTVEIPMRYAKCFAILNNGKKVGLRRSQQFTGWSGWADKRSFLFASKDILFEVKTDADQSAGCAVPGNIQSVIFETPPMRTANRREDVASSRARNGAFSSGNSSGYRKFIATDGSQIVLPAAN